MWTGATTARNFIGAVRETCVSLIMAGALALPQLAAAEISDGEIVIAALSDVTGTYNQSSGQGVMVAIELAAEDFGGQINGKPIRVLLYDTLNKPDVGVEVAKQAVAAGADLITDMPSSAVALAIQAYIRDETDRVIIHNGAGSEVLTGKACHDRGIQWQYNTGALSSGAGVLASQMKDSKWFVATVDHAFGRGIYNDVERNITPHGGKIVGSVFHSFSETNFFPIIQKAIDSKADILAIGNAGKGVSEAIRQAKEMGIELHGMQLVSIMTLLQDIRGVGLYAASGMRFVVPFYWNLNDGSRAFAERFRARMGTYPSEAQIANYTSTLHYLKAVQATGHDRGKIVVDKMKELPIDDGIVMNGYIRRDGRLVHDMTLVEVKKPSESKGLLDYFKPIATIPGEQAFLPETPECHLVPQG